MLFSLLDALRAAHQRERVLREALEKIEIESRLAIAAPEPSHSAHLRAERHRLYVFRRINGIVHAALRETEEDIKEQRRA